MKITCQACAAKYTIADEKVLGKIVKIRCKKCGATIVVNGNDPSASAGAGSSEPARAYDYVAQGAHGDSWTVNVADGDQRTLTDGEIADAYHAGIVDDETFCWKDGMTDWLPIREIEQLASACAATRAVAAPQPSSMPPPDGVTKIQQAGPGLFASSPPPAAHAAPLPRPASGNGGTPAPAPLAAARRTGGRAPAADLFGGAAQAGGEEDVMTSAPVGMPQAHDDAKLTGQRNENSVLFSLNALTSNAPNTGGGGGRPMPASSEASGLIDIRQLGAQIGIEDKKKSRIDDIMNLAGGGAFSPSLSAPVMSAPPLEEYAPPPEAAGATGQLPAASKSKGLIFGAIGAGVVVVCGAIGVAVMVMGKSDKADADKTAASASGATASTAPTTSAAGAEPSAAPSDTSTAAPAPTDSASAAATAAAAATTAKTAATTTAAAATAKPTTTATATAAPKETATAAAPAAAAGGSDQPFNMGEAKARLASIAGSVQGCKKGDVSGSGRVVVTFAPAGNVASAVVQGPPFAGTPTGACVSSRFRGAHVPAFAGSPFSVSKSFTIN
ncbi:MAG: zinc-ribbon domain-containing protein [Polyangiaceae bacterium]